MSDSSTPFNFPIRPELPMLMTHATMGVVRDKRPDYLRVRREAKPEDQIFRSALAKVASAIDIDLREEYERIEGAVATQISQITTRLNNMGLDHVNRQLLARPEVYVSVLKSVAFDGDAWEEIPDAAGAVETLMRELQASSGFRRQVVEETVGQIATKNNLNVDGQFLASYAATTYMRNLQLAPGALERTVLADINRILGLGSMPQVVEAFIARGEIAADRFTPAIKERMVEFLLSLGVQIDLTSPAQLAKFENGGFDEYLVTAFSSALRAQASGAGGGVTGTGAWDFSIDLFDTYADMVVDRDGMRAAAFLYYCFHVGEALHVLDMPEALYLEWVRGRLNLPAGPAANALEVMWRDKDRRDTAEERSMVYSKVLGLGESNMLSGMRVNAQFETLWKTLMKEAARYISKSEDKSILGPGVIPVSRIPIYQATHQLQTNLTESTVGATKHQSTRVRQDLMAALAVLDMAELVDEYRVGPRRDRYTVIKEIHAKLESFHELPPVEHLRTLAEEGYRVLSWVAEFEEGTVRDEQFDDFIHAAEAWIIAKDSEPEGWDDDDSDGDLEDDDDDFDESGEGDDFDDFDDDDFDDDDDF